MIWCDTAYDERRSGVGTGESGKVVDVEVISRIFKAVDEENNVIKLYISSTLMAKGGVLRAQIYSLKNSHLYSMYLVADLWTCSRRSMSLMR